MPADAARPIADVRVRIVGVLVLAFVFSALHDAAALAAMVVVTLGLVAVSGVAARALLHRLRWPGLVVAAFVLGLPFVTGTTPLATIGPVVMTAEGALAALTIALRFLCIFMLVAAWLGPVPVPRLIVGLQALGVPELIGDMALLALRHVSDMREGLVRRERALHLRGAPARSGLLHLRGWMLASLLLHSHARSEQVWHAMRLRGHGSDMSQRLPMPCTGLRDRVWLAGFLAVALGLLLLEHLA